MVGTSQQETTVKEYCRLQVFGALWQPESWVWSQTAGDAIDTIGETGGELLQGWQR